MRGTSLQALVRGAQENIPIILCSTSISSIQKLSKIITSDSQKTLGGDWNNKNPRNKFTGKAKDWVLKATFEVSDERTDAVRIEQFIKNQKSRKLIEKIIDPLTEFDGQLTQMHRVQHVRD